MANPFRTLDLTACLNAGTANLQAGRVWLWPAPEGDPDATPLNRLPAGDCRFWGVPFALAPEGADRRFVVVARADDTPAQASVPAGRRARRLLFAHACAPAAGERATVEGQGELIGTYRIRYEGGAQACQELRRRWEIHDVQIPWGHHPFLCRNCREFVAVPLGSRDLPWGRVQTAVAAAGGDEMTGWWLYDWAHPYPDRVIERIEVAAAGPTALVLGAITLCDEEEDPFVWPGRREIAIAVESPEGARPEVAMERGVVARQDDLLVPTEEYTTTDETGWGLGGQVVRPGAYAEIHGSPRGTLVVRVGAEEESRFGWGELLDRGEAERGPVRVEVVAPGGRQWVHVRVVDEDEGTPTSCRIHFRTAHGAYVAPHGHHADVNTGWFEDVGGDCKVRGTPYAYIDGTCQIELPLGLVYVEAARGFEYAPLRSRLEIKPGQRDLTLRLRRTFDMKARGYWSGDTHVHFLSTQASHLEAAAEDLNVVNLLASQWGRLFTNWRDFTGGLAPTSTAQHQIWVSQENRQHVLGHISLLGLREQVAPMCSGGPQEDWVGGEIQTLMADWAEACRRQGGLVVIPHMPVPDFENAADVVLGHADAAEMCWVWLGEQIGQGERGYYRWLNVGQKLPIVGGTDKMANNRVIGGSRTYARLRPGEEFTYASWCQAVRRGHTFASTGAFIELRVEGATMGDEIQLPGNGGTLEVEATAESIWPLSAVELIVNGVPEVRERPDGPERRIALKHKLKTEKPCWVAARCWGPYLTDAGPVMAHSSPVYVNVGGRRTFEPADGQYLLTHMEGGITWAQRLGVFRDEAVRNRLIGLFREAQGELRRRMA
ncbi:MAG: CehA/McbA family metallohydrolase [Gemmatimonadota bacterium]